MIFGRDMNLPIKHLVDWELILQQKQTKINKDNIRKNRHRFEHDYKVGYDFMLTKYTAYKYKISYTCPLVITQCFTNGMAELQNGATQIIYNIRHINPYKSDAKVEDYGSIDATT